MFIRPDKKIKVFFTILSISLLLLPNVSQAGFLDSLGCLECGNCGFASVAKGIIDLMMLLFGLMAAVSLIYFIWGGYQFLISGGNQERVQKGKQIMINTIFALIFAFSSNIAIKFIAEDFLGYELLSIEVNETLSECPSLASGTFGGEGCTSAWEGGTSCGGSCGGFNTGGINPQQCSDASPSLVSLLNCLMTGVNASPALNPGNIIITSISQDVGLATCRDNWNSSTCVHANGSCHYGGPSPRMDGSYAADIRSTGLTPAQRDAIKNIIESCGGNYYYHPPSDPPTHIHVSAGACGAI